MCVIQGRTGYAKVKTPEQSCDGACVDVEKMLQQEQVAISEKKCMYADADAESNATPQTPPRSSASKGQARARHHGGRARQRVAARDLQAVVAASQIRPLGRVVSAREPVGQRGGGGRGRKRHARARGPRAPREVC
ncbi:hypothetical protein PF005_g12414 [Phytophthora fragariae]|uniref:Uncharacterized protein n=1 Tax=Phytophthora fragariae TaxID=53985 RepID=A0A6A3U1B3_9STRA|nr:hypothetical protein PF003_g13054 [Phytophthora fragariae]KAE8937024.1 hypothetical protein PF009_g13060 [Phytophthora fragariae]KAE9007720.1 hypothetical protein PF011_g11009 [Phytophthora fragariae]KAE9108514.1 hypothetical protein PF010_g11877 [Phytophthora fragariae]KAE9109840.1 hypothetical protein PF007_g12096 [Phytophthora fragariae]